MKPIFKIGIFFFAALLLMPGALKSAHIFASHQHSYCDHSSESHIHQKTIDCNLVSLQQAAFPGIGLFSYEVLAPEEEYSSASSIYFLLIDRCIEVISLRGPPAVV